MKPTEETKEWFGEWFDSPYYHILYQYRDTTEAQHFIDNLASFMHFAKNAKLLDLACGKGRHSIYLNQKGFWVEGVDLSPQSIAEAQKHTNSTLQFAVHDMRKVYKSNAFDVVLNMFTSFGFFDTDEEHIKAIQAVASALTPNGHFVIDFFNTYKVMDALVYENTEQRGDITFHLKRYIENGVIIKDIHFKDLGRSFHFQERVKALKEQDFRHFFDLAGLQVLHLFGNYQLDFFDKIDSERMIFIVQKR